jgi:beta-galactosidase
VLLRPDAPAPPARAASGTPKLTRARGRTVVEAGRLRLELDDARAALVALSLTGKPVLTGAAPTVWRPLSFSEYNLDTRGGREPARVVDLSRGTTKAVRFDVQQGAGAVTVTCETETTVDEHNRIAATIVYTVDGRGTLGVDYTLRPAVQRAWLPEAGLALAIPPSFVKLRWLGLGPLDAYPNEKAAATLGVWSPAGDERLGAKAAVRWAEISDGRGAGLRVTGSPSVRWTPGTLRALAAVSGRSTKFARPERPEYEVDPTAEIKGHFVLGALAP